MTNNMANKVEICGVNTSKLPVLTNKEMRELFDLIHQGDEDARETFIQGNLRLVLSVIQRFNNRGENLDDLFQVGCIGLIKAIDNFDLSQNVKFSTYAVPMIVGEIRRYLRDNNPIRVSRSLRDIAYKALQVRDQLTNKNTKEPSINEISNELGYLEEVVFWMPYRIRYHCSSLSIMREMQSKVDQVSDEKTRMKYGWKILFCKKPCKS